MAERIAAWWLAACMGVGVVVFAWVSLPAATHRSSCSEDDRLEMCSGYEGGATD